MYSHLSETLHGLEVFRSYGTEHYQKQRFDQLQDKNISPFYLLLALLSTLSFWLDFCCSLYIGVVVAACFLSKGLDGSEIGFLITQAMGLTRTFQWGITQWSEFENEMISVERISQYIDIKSERISSCENAWPLSYNIEFKTVTLKYKRGGASALEDINFSIQENEKIGIVGRTGAGKSSLVSVLFRLANFKGIVTIGGTDITTIPIEILRSNICIIPQDPVLFSISIRENLDPFQQFTDLELWDVLEQVDLKSFVRQLPSCLDTQILEKGANLSVGQKQQFCLARALLRKNQILVLDEATASVDPKTDTLIRETIENRLSNCTLLIIAHRLHSVINCDKILVLDSGKVLEFGHPFNLLENEEGALYNLVAKNGNQVVTSFRKIAKEVSNKLLSILI